MTDSGVGESVGIINTGGALLAAGQFGVVDFVPHSYKCLIIMKNRQTVPQYREIRSSCCLRIVL